MRRVLGILFLAVTLLFLVDGIVHGLLGATAGTAPGTLTPYPLLVNLGISLIVGFLLPALGLYFLATSTPHDEDAKRILRGLRPLGWTTLAVAVSAFFILFATSVLAGLALLPAQHHFGLVATDQRAVFGMLPLPLLLLTALVAGVTEELVYRGFLQGYLFRRFPVWLAVTLQALLFALPHGTYGNWSHVLATFAIGIAAGLAYRRFGLLALMLAHALLDTVIFLILTTEAVAAYVFGALILLAVLANIYLPRRAPPDVAEVA